MKNQNLITVVLAGAAGVVSAVITSVMIAPEPADPSDVAVTPVGPDEDVLAGLETLEAYGRELSTRIDDLEQRAFMADSTRTAIPTESTEIEALEAQVKDFMAAIKFFNTVSDIAEDDGHHPDIHLTRYRSVAIELWTHAIGGLSENDFIVAAKIDQVPVELKN